MGKKDIFLDSFTSLDELTRKQQRDEEAVIAVLRKTGRFSVFDATANDDIARTMTRLCANRLTTDHEAMGYPWTVVTHIDGEPLASQTV